MNFKQLLIILVIFEISIITFILLIRNPDIDVEVIRAFAMWSTMTIGGCGLIIAINKFGIDFELHNSKKLTCVYKERYLKDQKIYHYFDLENRSSSDIYLDRFEGFKGIIETEDEQGDYSLIWSEEAKNFKWKSDQNTLSAKTHVIRPGDEFSIRLRHSSDRSKSEKLKIFYSVDSMYSKSKIIKVDVKFNREKNYTLFD